jgi:isopentenyl-diphosphate delta-isomerase
MARVVIVDEADTPIGIKDRDQITENDTYRVAALWVINQKEEVLLAKRSFSKRNDPGVWGPAVAGTVEEEESYESNIIKESEEEIGLLVTLDVLERGPKSKGINQFGQNYFTQWFIYHTDKPIEAFNPSPEEVASLKYFPVQKLNDEIINYPERFTRGAPHWIGKLIS